VADDEHRWAVSQKTGRASALESAVASLALTRQAYAAGSAGASPQSPPAAPESSGAACPQSDSGLTLPAGFCATIFADGIGHARHLVVAPDGVVYVNTWSGWYYGNDTPHAGGFLVALKDNTGAGKAVIPMPAPRAFRPSRRDQGDGCAGRSHLPRSSRRRDLHGLPRREREGHATGSRSHRRSVALGDGSYAVIAKIIAEGVPQPKQYRSPCHPWAGLSSPRIRCRQSQRTSGA